jgi:hypothetical protein
LVLSNNIKMMANSDTCNSSRQTFSTIDVLH